MIYLSSCLFDDKTVKTIIQKDDFFFFFTKGRIFYHSRRVVWSTYYYVISIGLITHQRKIKLIDIQVKFLICRDLSCKTTRIFNLYTHFFSRYAACRPKARQPTAKASCLLCFVCEARLFLSMVNTMNVCFLPSLFPTLSFEAGA